MVKGWVGAFWGGLWGEKGGGGKIIGGGREKAQARKAGAKTYFGGCNEAMKKGSFSQKNTKRGGGKEKEGGKGG